MANRKIVANRKIAMIKTIVDIDVSLKGAAAKYCRIIIGDMVISGNIVVWTRNKGDILYIPLSNIVYMK